MKEDNIDTFRQKDVNLRDAISMDEMECFSPTAHQ